ncbi:MAG: hypothetical protein E7039_00795 [Lentisphaerae bacterium]|nr:hypothetical protein [Lentisphaerota bacterium]
MTSWEKFEINSTDYLNNTFGQYAGFRHCGGTDSTKSDIKVITKSKDEFYIEAKECPAQCGQFVLLPDIESGTFAYSKQNTTPLNSHASAIINHMNDFFEEYKEAGTAGKDIYFTDCSQVFTDWIVQHYKDKNVRFIITNNNTILHTEKFADFFIVTAKYRTKRSGSATVGKKIMPLVEKYLQDNFSVMNILYEGRNLFISSNDDLHNQRFVIADREYRLSRSGNRYEIRKLSNTFNANVIFSINIKSGVQGLSIPEFIACLK